MPANLNYDFTYTLSATLAANERKEFQLVMDNDSYFQVEKMMSFHTERYKALIRDTSQGLPWSNIALVCENLFGTAQFPNILQTKMMIPPATTIYFDLENLTANPSEIMISLEGYRIYTPVTMPKRKFYVNGINMTLQPLNILDTSLILSNLGDFMVEKLVRYYDGEFDVRIAASGLSGRTLVSGLTHIDNLFGNALNPNIIAHPFKLVKNSLLQIYAKDRSGVVNNIQMTFEGSILLGGEESPEIV
jgi:hypothetical protein